MIERFNEGLAALNIDLPVAVKVAQLDFLRELLRWNQRINLTAIKDRQEALEKHLLDSLLLLEKLQGPGHLLDMGSGAGLPAIPLAIASPQLRVTSVDAVGKKITFQKHIKRLLQLDNLFPVQARLENLATEISPGQEFDQVVARAFAPLNKIFTLAAPCLKPGGELLAMKGPEGEVELATALSTMQSTGFTLAAVHHFFLPFSKAERQLLVFTKAAS